MQHYDHQIRYATKWPGRSRPPVHEQGPLCTNGDAATVSLQVQPCGILGSMFCFIQNLNGSQFLAPGSFHLLDFRSC